jgi:hypothetical protein
MLMDDTRTRLSRPWTTADDQQLRKLHDEGATVLRASAVLKRRSASVKKRAKALGLHLAGVREVKRQIRALPQNYS